MRVGYKYTAWGKDMHMSVFEAIQRNWDNGEELQRKRGSQKGYTQKRGSYTLTWVGVSLEESSHLRVLISPLASVYKILPLPPPCGSLLSTYERTYLVSVFPPSLCVSISLILRQIWYG